MAGNLDRVIPLLHQAARRGLLKTHIPLCPPHPQPRCVMFLITNALKTEVYIVLPNYRVHPSVPFPSLMCHVAQGLKQIESIPIANKGLMLTGVIGFFLTTVKGASVSKQGTYSTASTPRECSWMSKAPSTVSRWDRFLASSSPLLLINSHSWVIWPRGGEGGRQRWNDNKKREKVKNTWKLRACSLDHCFQLHYVATLDPDYISNIIIFRWACYLYHRLRAVGFNISRHQQHKVIHSWPREGHMHEYKTAMG